MWEKIVGKIIVKSIKTWGEWLTWIEADAGFFCLFLLELILAFSFWESLVCKICKVNVQTKLEGPYHCEILKSSILSAGRDELFIFVLSYLCRLAWKVKTVNIWMNTYFVLTSWSGEVVFCTYRLTLVFHSPAGPKCRLMWFNVCISNLCAVCQRNFQ